jgi:NADH dehydrogenase (ubiquinone) flavoprotein 2
MLRAMFGGLILSAGTLYGREPIGDNFVQVCTTTPCMLCGSTEILDTVLNHLNLKKPGETTKDGKFTVIEVECQGACSNAPMMVVGDDFYVCVISPCFLPNLLLMGVQEDLTTASTKKILDSFAKGQKPKPGPQSGRQTSENSAGLTALTSKVRDYFCIVSLVKDNLPFQPYGPGEYCQEEFR